MTPQQSVSCLYGERDVWRVAKVSSVEAEDQRHLHRDLENLKQERASMTTRIKAGSVVRGYA
jgi:cell division protein FtsB